MLLDFCIPELDFYFYACSQLSYLSLKVDDYIKEMIDIV